MSREQIVIAAKYMVIALGDEPSYRNVCAMIRKATGRGFREAEVRQILGIRDRAAFGPHLGREPAAPIEHEMTTTGRTRAAGGPPRARGAKVLESVSIPSPNGDGSGHQVALLETWQDAIVREVTALFGELIVDLSPDEIYRLGQLHALRFTRYRADVNKNRKLGMQLGRQIKNVITSREAFRDLTVREYLDYGKAIFDALPDVKQGKEWRTPWDITVYAE